MVLSLFDCWVKLCESHVVAAPLLADVISRHFAAGEQTLLPVCLEWYSWAVYFDGNEQVGRLQVDGDWYALYSRVPEGTMITRFTSPP